MWREVLEIVGGNLGIMGIRRSWETRGGWEIGG
jgi:hypothetical protein